MNPLMDILNMR